MNAAGIFGAHETIVNGVSGVLFTVWAPKALSVSVVVNLTNMMAEST